MHAGELSALAAMPSITPNILQSPLMIRQRIVIIFGGGDAMFVRSFGEEERKNTRGPDRTLGPFEILSQRSIMFDYLVGRLSNSRNEDCLPLPPSSHSQLENVIIMTG